MTHDVPSTSRAKQDQWKERVPGGQLFKKNQERSFIDALKNWHSLGILRLYMTDGQSVQGEEMGGAEEGEQASKRRAIAGRDKDTDMMVQVRCQ